MKKIIITKIFFLFLLSNIGFGFNAKAQNASDIMIAPHTFEFNVKKGEKIESKIKILNKGSLQMPFKVKTIDFTAEDETGKMIFESPDDISPAKWINIKDTDFILGPDETKIVNFSIDIPHNINAGGYYATIIFEPQLPSIYFEKDKPRAIPEIGALVLFAVEMEGLERSENLLSVAEFSIPEKYHLKKAEEIISKIAGMPKQALATEKKILTLVESDNLSFNVKIKNEDIFHNRYSGKLEIISATGGKILGNTEIPRNTILPGKSRLFPVEFVPDTKSGYFIGKYKANLTLNQEGLNGFSNNKPDNVIQQTIEFWIFPWKYMLVYIIFISILILLRKRIIIAFKILMGKRVEKSHS